LNEGELYQKLCRKDPAAFETVMDTYNRLLWAIVGSILNNVGTNEDIEECVADTYYKLWENPKAFDYKKGTIKTYLAVIAKNKALDRYRKLSKQKLAALDEAISYPSTDDDLLEYITKTEKNISLYEALNALKEPDREIMIRRFLFDEKPSYIADKFSVPTKEVENRIYQSKLRLKRYLMKQEGVDYGL